MARSVTVLLAVSFAALAVIVIAVPTTPHDDERLAAWFTFDAWKSQGSYAHCDAGRSGFSLEGGVAANVERQDTKFGTGAVRFTGSEFGVAVRNPVQFGTTKAATISMWLKTTETTPVGEPRFLVTALSNDAMAHASLVYMGDSVAVLYDSDALELPATATVADHPINDGAWHQVILRIDGAFAKLCVDGVCDTGYHLGGMPEVMPGDNVFVGGHPPFGAGDVHGFVGLIDNVRMYNVAFTDSELLDLYQNDAGGPGPIPLTSSYSGTLSQVVVQSGSHMGGSYSHETEYTGSIVFDMENRRGVRHLTDAEGGVESTFLFAGAAGQLEFTVTRDASGSEQCALETFASCVEWPSHFMCLPERQDCGSSHCGHKDNLWTVTTWDGPPPVCSIDNDAAPGAVMCTTSYSYGATTATVTESGLPLSALSSSCTPSPTSVSCYTQTVEFDVQYKPAADGAFVASGLGACFANHPEVCSTFCNNRGTCDPSNPGRCICDNPNEWTGNQCESEVVPTCELGEWSEWSACSAPCGGGTQTQTASWVPVNGGSCIAAVETRSRPCNEQPCGDIVCPVCTGGTSGPCQNPFNSVCYNFYEGSTTCPAGTVACGASCNACVGGTTGPCRHNNDGTCTPFLAGTNQCPPGTTWCATEIPSSACSGCWPGSSGECQQSNTVCWDKLASGSCPVGTTDCATVGSLRAAPAAVVDLELTGVSEQAFRGSEQQALQAAVGPAANVPILNVQIEAVRDSMDVTSRSTDSGASSTWSCNADGVCGSVTPGEGVKVGTVIVQTENSGSAADAAMLVQTAVEDGTLLNRVQSTPGLEGVTGVRLVADPVVVNSDSTTGAAPADVSGNSTLLIAMVSVGVVLGAVGVAAVAVVALRKHREAVGNRVTRIRPVRRVSVTPEGVRLPAAVEPHVSMTPKGSWASQSFRSVRSPT